MAQTSDPLVPLGWNDWFSRQPVLRAGDTPARVIAVDRELLLLADASGSFRARLSGSFMHQHSEAEERPCVGDWVCVQHQGPDQTAIIHQVLERRSWLCRKAIGSSSSRQMIAANIDCVFIAQSCHYDFNLKRLERYLAMVYEGGADAFILLTKSDLVDEDTRNAQLRAITSAGITAPVLVLSNLDRSGIQELLNLLEAGKTYCLVGSSGVGKSTLINQLTGSAQLATATVSESGEGRHTTVRRELIRLESGAFIIDNPGMREFGITGDAGLASSHADINALAATCRYPDCSHRSEPGCAVLEALEKQAISREHYDNYLKLTEEAKFNDMSYAEKRKKDRDFGRFLKSAKKDIRNR